MQVFNKGMDISFVPQCEDEGMAVYDRDGIKMDPLALAKKYGVNSIRLRIWNDPDNVPESKGYCSLEQTIRMAKRIKQAGMGFVLDFHYSDFWADPANQKKPAAWEGLSFPELTQAVYEYTRDVINKLRSEDVLPDMVQIGNEIRSGLLFPDGELPNYAGMTALVNAGIRGAKEAGQGEVKIMIHLDQGGRYFYLKEWFDKAFKAGLEDFDVIGLSYYPFWHGSFGELKQTLLQLIQDYGKPIMIVETAHAWRKSQAGFIDEAQERIAGVPATPEGQKKVLDLVMNIVSSLPDGMGQGVYYWEPLCVPRPGEGGWAENMGLLDENGRAMEGIEAFLFEPDKAVYEKAAKIYEPEAVYIHTDKEERMTLSETLEKQIHAVLPETVRVLYYDGTVRELPVTWDMHSIKQSEKSGQTLSGNEQIVSGHIKEIDETVQVKVVPSDSDEEERNLFRDPNWDSGLVLWNIESSDEKTTALVVPEFIDPFPAPPVNSLRVEGKRRFQFTVCQKVAVSEPGTYKLSVQYRGTDTTGVDIKLYLKDSKGEKIQVIHPMEHDWQNFEISAEIMQPEELEAGIRIDSPPVYGLIRNLKLVLKP